MSKLTLGRGSFKWSEQNNRALFISGEKYEIHDNTCVVQRGYQREGNHSGETWKHGTTR